MKLQYFEAQPVYPVYLGNTGDGLKMAQKAGAGLWHMWHFHGGYGFKFAELPFAIRHVWAGPRNENRKMIWIAVDKFGKRFMDEYPPAPQDTGTRPLEYYDADIQDYPRIPCYLIFDEEGRKLGPIGIPIVNDERYDASWSDGQSRRDRQEAGSRKATHWKTSPRKSTSIPKCSEPRWNAGMISAPKARTKTTNGRRKP